MSPVSRPDSTNAYWRSLDELADTPEFRRWLEAEFPAAAELQGVSRRRWLQLMGASLALAGVTGCRWPKAEILPLKDRPQGRIPGKAQEYATTMELPGGNALGLLVTCYDGRPVKVEGNPKHPQSLGATNACAQAAILELYDPDRSRHVVERSGSQSIRHDSWQGFIEFGRAHFGALKEAGGAGLAVLAQPSTSPTRAALRDRLLERFPQATWCEYEPLGGNAGRCRTHWALKQADVIVCLDADILGCDPESVRLAREFAARRCGSVGSGADGTMNRLYVVESCVSITGAMADHRLAVRSSAIGAFAAVLEQEVTALLASPQQSEPEKRRRRVSLVQQAALADIVSTLLDRLGHEVGTAYGFGGGEPPGVDVGESQRLGVLFALAEDLVAGQGRSVVAAGPRQAAEVHAAVDRINAALGNVGHTVTYSAAPAAPPSGAAALRSLVADMRAGKVSTLLILGGNPVYNAPADLDFAGALAWVETTIHLGLYRDETGRQCTWHLPEAHFLESWGDAGACDGTYSLVQPLIAPLYGGKTAGEVLAMVVGDVDQTAYDQVRAVFAKIAGGDDGERRWRQTLHNGVLPDSRWPALQPQRAAAGPRPEPSPEPAEADSLEIVFCQDACVYDGRFANSGWLQETPDPMTRLAWDNVALIAPRTAQGLGVEDGTLVRLKLNGREIEIPAYVMPGQAEGSVAVSLGYGRTAAGHVGGLEDDGVEPVGVDVYPLRTSDAMHYATGLEVEPTGKRVRLATVQDHFAIDRVGMKARDRRAGELIQETTPKRYEDYQKLSDEERQHVDIDGRPRHHLPAESLWQEHRFEGHRWGMVIDLSRCTGCGACVVACQAENNIPVVGRQRVLEGREMQWLRIDRYFRGDPQQPDGVRVAVQPMPCQHCELAPCEQVCPVAATVHDREGLNVMVYNRCVGTRYCSNNCPFKVRRFNFFYYHPDLEQPENEVAKMKYNPEVTVRSRGVMEKCTYCTQRIQAAKMRAKRHRRAVRDDEIQTACQQACPAGAIVFGDLSDANSRVAKAKLAAVARSYTLLEGLNVKPRTAYLARLRNPNPALEV